MMKKTDTFRLLLLTTVMLLTSLTVQAQNSLIRRNTTTTTTTTRTTRRTTTTRSQTQPVKPPKVTTGTISITSTPTDAAVKIDGEYMGTTPLTLRNRKAGTYSITISNEGYDSQTRTITVTAGKTATCSVTLKKKQTQQQATTQQPAQRQSATTSSSTSSQNFTVGGVTFKMIRVEGGTFTMGATAEQGGDTYSDESPTHRVTLSTYYIGETEVTQALWEAVMGSNPSLQKGANCPVEQVSWEDCQNFVRELNRMTGKNFRLPTEAEWEFAARGGNKSSGCKYSGSNAIDKVAWNYGNSVIKKHDVKTKSPNELGIYDMSGNVWEWCQDRYGAYSSSSQTNPTGASSGSDRVFRGGSWSSGAWGCRVSNRGYYTPGSRNFDLGLRLAL